MKTYPELTREERIKRIKEKKRDDLVLVLENITDEKNIALILRTSECFGINQIYIIYQKGAKPKILKSLSSGAYKWLSHAFYTSTKTCLKDLKKKGFKIVSSVVDPKSVPVWNYKFTGKIAILIGNEVSGLSKKALAASDVKLYIPMLGLTESLNVSVATAIFLYEAIRPKVINFSNISQQP